MNPIVQPKSGSHHIRDAGLAQAVAENRDEAAFAMLFDHYAPRLNAYLQKLGLPRGQAEDMAQEVMTVLWQKAALYDPSKSSLSTWLFRIARNRRIDAARRARSQIADPDDPSLWPEPEAMPDAALDEAGRAEMVRKAMESLPEDQRVLVRAAFFLGRTHAEISAETGLPLGTVKSRLRLAFAKLRLALAGLKD